VTAAVAALPQLPGLPIFGATLALKRDPIGTLQKIAALGDVVRLPIPGVEVVHVNDVELVEHLMHDRYKDWAKQTRGYAALRTVLGNGLLTSEGAFWLRQRRLAQPAFHKERIAGWGEVMVRATREMVDRWAPRLQSGEAFDIHAEMMRLTLRVVGETILSADITGSAGQVGQALGPLLELLAERVLALVRPPEWVPWPLNLRIRHHRKKLDVVVNGLIAERRKKGAGDDLLGMFMTATDADTGEQMDDAQLRDEVMTMMLAGHETTANALSWAFTLLAQAPEAEARLRAELDAVLGGREPIAADAPRLPYTLGVLHEALRLYPPVWLLGRAARVDDVLGGVTIPKGTIVFFSPYLIHRRADLWPEPQAFRPERWLTEVKRPRCAYLAFSTGPRKCIGDQFALLEGQLVLATMLQRVRLSLARPVVPQPHFTLRPERGVMVTARPR
jgi:cytochrome P450